jgi:hypothetical protein
MILVAVAMAAVFDAVLLDRAPQFLFFVDGGRSKVRQSNSKVEKRWWEVNRPKLFTFRARQEGTSH